MILSIAHVLIHRCGRIALLLVLTSCASTVEFTNRPKEPISWPPGFVTPRIELDFVYRGTVDAKQSSNFWNDLLNWVFGKEEQSFVSPYGLTKSGQILWVTDPGRACVHRLDLQTGEHSIHRGSDVHPFQTPIGIARMTDGRVAVTDSNSCWVTILSEQGEVVRTFGGPQEFQRPTGILFDGTLLRFLILDTVACQILAYDELGQGEGRFGRRGNGPGEFNAPTHLARAPTGEVLVVDSLNCRIQVLSKDLEPIRSFGEVGRGPGNFASPRGIAVDSKGRVYVADSMYDNVQIFTMQGDLLLRFASPGHQLGQCYLVSGIHITDDDRIIVADKGNSRIQVFELELGEQ